MTMRQKDIRNLLSDLDGPITRMSTQLNQIEDHLKSQLIIYLERAELMVFRVSTPEDVEMDFSSAIP